MNINQAIQQHAEWKIKFRSAISKQENLDVATISKDNCCDLGKWLHGEAKTKLGMLQSYTKCVANHATFHTEAAKVAQTINSKKYDEAEKMLSAGTSYTQASNAVGGALIQLKKEAGL
jgi:methyl-accepting chemotaxis protein